MKVRIKTGAALLALGVSAGLLVNCSREAGLEQKLQQPSGEVCFGLQADEQNLIPGEMIIKVTPDLGEQIEARTDEDGSVMVGEVPALKSAESSLRIESMARLFPYAGKFEERTRAEGLHLWYRVSYSKSAPATRAASEFGGIDGVVAIEACPKIKIIGDPVVVEEAVMSSAPASPSATYPFNDPRLKDQWHYFNDGSASSSQSGCDINVFPVWKTYTTGRPDVIVSVVDGGIDYTHEDLADNMWENPEKNAPNNHGYNFCNKTYGVSAAAHGTHVAGTIAAVNNNSVGVCGIAGGDFAKGQPGVKLMSCQIFSDVGEGSGAGADAIKWGADHGAVISQNSWGFTDPSMTEAPGSVKAAVDYFIKYAGFDENGNQTGPMAGGIVIFAAGNDNLPTSTVAYDKSVMVTSVGADYKKAYYSCWGDWAHIAAPGGDAKKGNQVLSTLPGNKYGIMQGTSMACPHVSGVAALIVSQYGGPGFTSQALRDRLLNNTTDISAYNRTYNMGAGLVNAYMAIAGSGGKAPDNVTDYSVTAQSNNLEISVTIPSDEDDWKPNTIIIYYDTKNITNLSDAMFSSFYVGELEPGDVLTGKVTGLEFNTDYYLAAVACDLAGNKSAGFTVKTSRTGGNSDPVITVSGATDFSLKPHERARLAFTAIDPDGHYLLYELNKASEAETLDTLDKSKPGIDIVAVDAPTGKYSSSLVITDIYGGTSSLSFSYEVLENHKPEVVGQMEDLIFSAKAEKREIPEPSCFKDDDGEQLSYTITNTDENVANVNYSKGVFYVTSLNYGMSTVNVTATDIRGETASQSFRILVRNSTEEVEVYPNPVKDYLYVRTSEESTAVFTVVNSLGSKILEEDIKVSPFEPAKVDFTSFKAGVYSVIIDFGGQTYKKTIVKI